MPLLDDILRKLEQLPTEEFKKIRKEAFEHTKDKKWVPLPGPQMDAYLSKADVLLFGGRSAGGKSNLLLGIGVNDSTTGIILRRELAQTDGLERDGKNIIGSDASFNGQDLEWTWPTAKSLKLGGMKGPDDWMNHAGRERDFIGFDEGGEFLEIQVSAMFGWLRAPKGKRTRAVIASNPPRTAEGLWLVKWFAPWLDPKHPLYPTSTGQLRWAIHVSRSGQIDVVWVDGPGEYEVAGDKYIAKSYTFIPASLADNPYRNTPEYKSQLQSLPEPLRSQLLYGDFGIGMSDMANQVVPTQWVLAAQNRWKPEPPRDVPMCAMGVDCSGGGEDQMVQAPRYDGWYAPLIKTPGKSINPEHAGSYAAGLVVGNRRDNAIIVVDLGGGYGGPLFEHLKDNEIECVAFKGAEATTRKTKDGKLKFFNKRSAAYWQFREALDPDQPRGSPIALPSDSRLLAGLTAPTFEITPRGIKIEPKVVRDKSGKVIGGVMFKIGFSPDEADAVVMAWFHGQKNVVTAEDFDDDAIIVPHKRKVLPNAGVRGYAPLSARYANPQPNFRRH